MLLGEQMHMYGYYQAGGGIIMCVGDCMLHCRCSSLMLSVNHLAMLAKTACSLSGVLDWVDQSLADVEEHLKVYAFCLLS